MAQLMPLQLTVSCFSKIQMVFPYWYRLTRVVPHKGPVKPATDEPGNPAGLPGRANRVSFVMPGQPGSCVAGPVHCKFSVKNQLLCNAFSLPGLGSRLVCRGTRAAWPSILRCFPFKFTYLLTHDVTCDDTQENG